MNTKIIAIASFCLLSMGINVQAMFLKSVASKGSSYLTRWAENPQNRSAVKRIVLGTGLGFAPELVLNAGASAAYEPAIESQLGTVAVGFPISWIVGGPKAVALHTVARLAQLYMWDRS